MTMSISRKKSGFTLIETMVASVIMVIVLSSAIAVGRGVQANATRSEEQLQMTSLVNESLDNVALLRDALSNGSSPKSLGEGIGLVPGKASKGVFAADVGCGQPVCPKVEEGGALRLKWCDLKSFGSSACSMAVSPVAMNDTTNCSTGTNCPLETVYRKFKLKGIPGNGYELVAVRTRPLEGPEKRSVLDASSLSESNPDTVLYIDGADGWSLYARQIEITRLSGSPLQDASYQVTSTVYSYRNQSQKVSRTVLITDRK
jgi:prepilin-type N-terminal cleavage/methylation domain-containing protein